MFVANRMTKNPVTIAPDASLDDAFMAMKKGHFRRLPVVEDGKLVGFFSDKDLMRVAPSPATTLSRYEEKSLLDKLKVAEIMNKDVISVGEDATIEEAALIMYDKKIGGLPVISAVGAVVGVITETDIFKTFVVNATGLNFLNFNGWMMERRVNAEHHTVVTDGFVSIFNLATH